MKCAVYTLIDITATYTKILENTNLKLRNQQRNWETAYQIVNLRHSVEILASSVNPKMVCVDYHEFGDFYQDQHRCWKFMFKHRYSFLDTTKEEFLRTINYDFDRVPIIAGLDETIILPDPVFRTIGPLKNTYFKILSEKD